MPENFLLILQDKDQSEVPIKKKKITPWRRFVCFLFFFKETLIQNTTPF